MQPEPKNTSPDEPEKTGSTSAHARMKRGGFLRRRRWLIVSIATILIAGIYWGFGDDPAPTSKPLFATAEIGDIENAVTAAGTLQPSKFVDVGAQVSGQLDTLFVEVGDVVESGGLVAEIDATVQINRVEGSRASLRAQEAQ